MRDRVSRECEQHSIVLTYHSSITLISRNSFISRAMLDFVQVIQRFDNEILCTRNKYDDNISLSHSLTFRIIIHGSYHRAFFPIVDSRSVRIVDIVVVVVRLGG